MQVFCLLGGVCLDAGDAARARELYLNACRMQPSCSSWFGAGTACIALDKLDEAVRADPHMGGRGRSPFLIQTRFENWLLAMCFSHERGC